MVTPESGPFSAEQQEYLKGFAAGIEARQASGLMLPAAAEPSGPADPQRAAQDRAVAAGGTLVPEEQAKRAKHPLDRFDDICAMAAARRFPKGTDVFLGKYFGLFYVAPAQTAYMCRLRIPGGILTAAQCLGVADIAEDLGGVHVDITTRANLQIREIGADGPPEVLMRLAEIGLTSRGAGADNVRNITGSPTAGIDPQELIDTRPHVRALHHAILHDRDLYGLPRKFNIAFDGGGRIPVLQETNDIAFTASRLADGEVVYRLALGGITGHRDFARETGVIVAPEAAARLARAVLTVFIAEGSRTDRTRARLKYVLDRMGLPAFLERVEAAFNAKLRRIDTDLFAPPPDRLAHVGVHPQKQDGRFYIGVTVPRARLTAAQLRGLADLAERVGSATIRLTVWQNLLISDIAEADLPAALAALRALGLSEQASTLRAGLVACTGNAGCKFAAGNTKAHGEAIVAYLEPRVAPDVPVNIHVTGCHHSCAQHFVADIGLLATKVEQGEESVEGYDLHVGGGILPQQAIGRLIREKIAFADLPPMLLALLSEWQRTRDPGQGFRPWTEARDDAALLAITDLAMAAA